MSYVVITKSNIFNSPTSPAQYHGTFANLDLAQQHVIERFKLDDVDSAQISQKTDNTGFVAWNNERGYGTPFEIEAVTVNSLNLTIYIMRY